jgi:hypothetical protein
MLHDTIKSVELIPAINDLGVIINLNLEKLDIIPKEVNSIPRGINITIT